MIFDFEHEPSPIEKELNQEAEFEAIQEAMRSQLTEAELQQIHDDIHGPHTLVSTLEMQMKAQRIVDEFKKCIDDDEMEVKYTQGAEPTTLHIRILCDALYIDKSFYQSLMESLECTDGITIMESNNPGQLNCSIGIKNFYTKNE